MTPKTYMVLGAVAAIVSALMSIGSDIDASVMLFAAGALFGKGYGVWEERNRSR